MQAMTVEMVFDLLGARLDGPLADGTSLALGWSFPDVGEQWTLRVEHGAVNCWPVLDDDVHATVTLTRETLVAVLVDGSSIPAAVQDGTVMIEGQAEVLDRLLALLDGRTGPSPSSNPDAVGTRMVLGLIELALILAVLGLLGVVGWSLWTAVRQSSTAAPLPSRHALDSPPLSPSAAGSRLTTRSTA